MAIAIDRLTDSGPVELTDGSWRGSVVPGQSIAHLASDMQATINAHWSTDVDGQTRAQRYTAMLAADEPEASRVIAGTVFLARVTDQEMMTILAAGDHNAQIRRWIEQLRMLGEIDLDGATAQAAKVGLVAAGLLTQERAEIIFA